MSVDPRPDRVTTDSAFCHGQPCIRGTRVLLRETVDALKAGLTTHEIVDRYPTLTSTMSKRL